MTPKKKAKHRYRLVAIAALGKMGAKIKEKQKNS